MKFWNQQKVKHLPRHLKNRLLKVFQFDHPIMFKLTMLMFCLLSQTRVDLRETCSKLLHLQEEIGTDLSTEYCKECMDELQRVARGIYAIIVY